MNKNITIIVLMAVACFSALCSADGQVYMAKAEHKGTKLPEGSPGFVNNNHICKLPEKTMPIGGLACALVPVPAGAPFGARFTIKEDVCVTCTPAPNLVGFIEGSIKKGKGMGGDRGTAVYRLLMK